jgi:hypothetical protein
MLGVSSLVAARKSRVIESLSR